MNKKQLIAIIAIIVVGAFFGAFVLFKGTNQPGEGEANGQAEASQAESKGSANKGSSNNSPQSKAAKGTHGGELSTKGDFGLEIALVEEAGEARLTVYLSSQGKPLPPTSANVSATLTSTLR